jgi:hypothetical protein
MSTHHQKNVRYTIELPFEMHKYLRVASAIDNSRMNSCIKEGIEMWIKAREEKLDEADYLEGKEESQRSGFVDWKDAKKRLGL